VVSFHRQPENGAMQMYACKHGTFAARDVSAETHTDSAPPGNEGEEGNAGDPPDEAR
jgi:hypothetical protein